MQEESREAQERLKKQLDDVGSQVESTGTDVKEVGSNLSKLGNNMEDLKLQQCRTAEGIYILCRCQPSPFPVCQHVTRTFPEGAENGQGPPLLLRQLSPPIVLCVLLLMVLQSFHLQP